MSASKGSSDESIGRPAEWREGRYQQPQKSVDQTVETGEKASDQPAQPESTAVTERDYQSLQKPEQNDTTRDDPSNGKTADSPKR